MEKTSVFICRNSSLLFYRLQLGANYHDQGLVFCKDDGSFAEPSYVSKVFKKNVAKAGLNFACFKSMRKTFATLLAESGIPPKTLMYLMGHTTLAVTMKYYVQFTPKMMSEAAEHVESLLAP